MKRGVLRPAGLPFMNGFERQGFIWLFMTPTLLLVLLVSFLPIIYAFKISLYQTRFLEPVRFIGLDNYIDLFQEPSTWEAIWTSISYMIGSAVVTMPLGLGLALLMNRPLPFMAAIRGILIMPWVISQTVAAMLWVWLLEPSFGPINYIIASTGHEKVLFLADPNIAKFTVIFANIWLSYPLPMIMLTAALKTIPEEVVDAVRIDGAGRWAIFRYITLPFLQPTLMSTAIMLTLLYLNMVTLIYIMTGGGPLNVTETLSVRVFKESFLSLRVGVGAALGSMIFGLNLLFSMAYVTLLKQQDEDLT